MFNFVSDRVININLNNGLYIFSNESATGKTFLYKMLSKLSSHKEILCITYTTAGLIKDLRDIVKEQGIQILVLDRYDMYEDKFVEDIMKLSDNITILMDYKNGDVFNKIANDCYIELTETKLEVNTYGTI